ncbi:MAG: hypothetical protein WC685_10335 [Methylobacter sp.]
MRKMSTHMVRKAFAASGSVYIDPQGSGFMYGHDFQDLGRLLEIMFIEPRAINQA